MELGLVNLSANPPLCSFISFAFHIWTVRPSLIRSKNKKTHSRQRPQLLCTTKRSTREVGVGSAITFKAPATQFVLSIRLVHVSMKGVEKLFVYRQQRRRWDERKSSASWKRQKTNTKWRGSQRVQLAYCLQKLGKEDESLKIYNNVIKNK